MMIAHCFQPSLTMASLMLSLCAKSSHAFTFRGLNEEMEGKGIESVPGMIGICRGAMCLFLCLCSSPFQGLKPCICIIVLCIQGYLFFKHCRDTGPRDTGPREGCRPLRAWLTGGSQMQQVACATEGPICCPLLSPPKWPLA